MAHVCPSLLTLLESFLMFDDVNFMTPLQRALSLVTALFIFASRE